MKANYLASLLLAGVILFRAPLLDLTNNITKALFIKNKNLEIIALQKQNEYLANEYEALLDFKNNIDLKYDYTVTNVIKNNYGFKNLIISGTDYAIGSEVITPSGLIGLVSKTNVAFAEVLPLYSTQMVINVNNETGKITGKDEDHNLIIEEISNYNNVKINDPVYSIYGTYIGKVIKIKYDVLDNYLTVKTIPLESVGYVIVISR